MRRFATVLLATTASVGLGVSAMAADMPVKAPIAKAPVVASEPWTGCYIGGNIGYARTKDEYSRPDDNTNDGFHTADGFAGGAQVGCDFQITSQFVVGAQGMWDWTDLTGSHASLLNPSRIESSKASNFATATGRIGWLLVPSALAYLKGGGAWVRDRYTGVLTTGADFRAAEFTRSGWTFGGGVEWMFARNWSAFAEYNFMDFGTRRVSYPPGDTSTVQNINQNVQTVLFGVNYHFITR